MNKEKLLLLGLLLLALIACEARGEGTVVPASEESSPLEIVATTTIVGDVVRQVVGDVTSVTVLIPPGADSHGFEPSPQDIAAVADADVLFISGLGLEGFLEPMLENVGGETIVVSLSDEIDPLESEGEHADEHEGEEDEHDEEGEEHEHENIDPHVWLDPNNVILWVREIEETLSDVDPAHAEIYRDNAESYVTDLQELDRWIEEQVATVPKENRELVTDHEVFSYFAEAYGFEQVGTVIRGVSTMEEPSAQELADLQDAIRALDIPAIFVGTTVNPTLAEAIAADTSTEIRRVYIESLSEADGPASNYLEYMRYNVETIVEALKASDASS
ncbi:MAG: metal ABC transporter substrate-binding protein [Chloroflexota bacterium]|nr:metal ABC transporter substrate-binding protein [Chloroflexota bacterium]